MPRRSGNDLKFTSAWHGLAGASTVLPLRCSESGKLIWKKQGYRNGLKNSNAAHVEVMVSEHPDLLETEKAK